MQEEHISHCDASVWLNVAQATQYLQISRTTLYRLIESGDLPAYRLTGTRQRRFKRGDLDQLMVLETSESPIDDNEEFENRDSDKETDT
ncbi:MAG: helix-turn-helix domain-containing protein [Chloroflexota bacterium]